MVQIGTTDGTDYTDWTDAEGRMADQEFLYKDLTYAIHRWHRLHRFDG